MSMCTYFQKIPNLGNFVYLKSCQYMAARHYNFSFDLVFQYHRMLSMYPKIPRLSMLPQLQKQMFERLASSIA